MPATNRTMDCIRQFWDNYMGYVDFRTMCSVCLFIATSVLHTIPDDFFVPQIIFCSKFEIWLSNCHCVIDVLNKTHLIVCTMVQGCNACNQHNQLNVVAITFVWCFGILSFRNVFLVLDHGFLMVKVVIRRYVSKIAFFCFFILIRVMYPTG